MRKPMLPILTAVLTIAACASGPQPTKEPELPASQTDMQTCLEELPVPLSGAMTDLLNNHIAVAKAYHQCKDRHNGLVRWLEKTDEVR